MFPETLDEAIFELRESVRATSSRLAGVCVASGHRQPGLDEALEALDALVSGDPADVPESVMNDAAEMAQRVFESVMDRAGMNGERDHGIYERARKGYDDAYGINDAAKSIDSLRHSRRRAR